MPADAELWVLRHGESTANAQGLIVSLPGPRALTEVGLTPTGRAQARDAAEAARVQGLGPDTLVISSDFARARETAEVFAAQLGAGPVRIDQRLRERRFGIHDEGLASAYETVWEADRARRTPEGDVEPVPAVAARVDAAIADAARAAASSSTAAQVVLVAHGDILQIALALGEGQDPHDHREVPHLGNAELRRLGPHRPGVHRPGAHRPDDPAAT